MKSEQLQIRVSSKEKRLLKNAAKSNNQDMSQYILSRALNEIDNLARFKELVSYLMKNGMDSYHLASLNDLLSRITAKELNNLLQSPPSINENRLVANYVCAMLEEAATVKGISTPAWLNEIKPLERPWFASQLQSLRTHLIANSPIAFKRRNLFVDTSIRGRV